MPFLRVAALLAGFRWCLSKTGTGVVVGANVVVSFAANAEVVLFAASVVRDPHDAGGCVVVPSSPLLAVPLK